MRWHVKMANYTTFEEGGLLGKDPETVLRRLAGSLRGGGALICVDAPLGWPARFGSVLQRHTAGDPIHLKKNTFFRRHTDEVMGSLGKWPLEVAADRIARAAHEALHVVQQLRRFSGLKLDLAWDPKMRQPGVIETYPAATVRAHGFAPDYRKNPETTESLFAFMGKRIKNLPDPGSVSDDEADAIVCLQAGLDFLAGDCLPPNRSDKAVAKKEGWIWVHRKFAD